MISTEIKEVLTDGKTKSQKNYLTTTELARICGVSRFSIINWINQGKIRAFRTVGRQYRIPASEAISFFETFHKVKNTTASGLLVRCWEYLQKTNCDKECRNCLIYERRIDYCFVVVRQFGKGVIRCKGDCLNCDYFNEIFNKSKKIEKPSDGKIDIIKEKKDSLYHFGYNVGYSVQGLKERIKDLKKRFIS